MACEVGAIITPILHRGSNDLLKATRQSRGLAWAHTPRALKVLLGGNRAQSSAVLIVLPPKFESRTFAQHFKEPCVTCPAPNITALPAAVSGKNRVLD